ncbi:MAG TPA: hypothetical protein VN512_13105 [Clostridia bacterium]|nr:hypothetical protein [Clostridia bacterium]
MNRRLEYAHNFCRNCGKDLNAPGVTFDGCCWAESAIAENEPLTLDELRQMDGEPVWCEGETRFGTNFAGWKVVARNNLTPNVVRFTDQTDWTNDSYGKAWLVYRSKPKASAIDAIN